MFSKFLGIKFQESLLVHSLLMKTKRLFKFKISEDPLFSQRDETVQNWIATSYRKWIRKWHPILDKEGVCFTFRYVLLHGRRAYILFVILHTGQTLHCVASLYRLSCSHCSCCLFLSLFWSEYCFQFRMYDSFSWGEEDTAMLDFQFI